MDPRPPPQQQAQPGAYPRTVASSFIHASFQTPANSVTYSPSASNPPLSRPLSGVSDHRRRPSDPVQVPPPRSPYYPQSQSHSGPASVPPPQQQSQPSHHQHHQRHQSTPSISSAPPMNRGVMPPPGSSPKSHSHYRDPAPHYGLPAPRAPPVSVGPPGSFSNGRDLPSITALSRAPSAGSSMSIASMLGGGRDPSQQTTQFAPPATTAPASGPTYSPSVHASPHIQSSSVDFGPRFRPHTPDVLRSYDHRGNNATSPHQLIHRTPDIPRYGTPQTSVYGRPPPLPPHDSYRDQRGLPPALPQRPNSTQPKLLHNPLSSSAELNQRPPDQGALKCEESMLKYNPECPVEPYDEHLFMERERQERKIDMLERERRHKTFSGGERSGEMHPVYNKPYQTDIRDVQNIQDRVDPRELKDARVHADMRDPRGTYIPRDSRATGPLDSRNSREGFHEIRDASTREARDTRDSLCDLRDPRKMHRDQETKQHHDIQDQRELREPLQWQHNYDQRLPYDPAGPPHSRPVDYPPVNSGPQFPHPSSSSHPIKRYTATTQPTPQADPARAHNSPIQPFESPERSRVSLRTSQHSLQHHGQPQHIPPVPSQQQPPRQQQKQTQQPPLAPHAQPSRPIIQEPALSSQGPYLREHFLERPREELKVSQQKPKNHLQVEINRKGRLSPLPQAVQGVQPQAHGPSGEPVIKNEFGRIFSGLGAVVSSPITPTAHLAFPSSGGLRRDDDSQTEAEPKQATSRAKRRIHKEDELRSEENSTVRHTPANSRTKRPKTHPHQHSHVMDSPSRAAKNLAKMSHHLHIANQSPSVQVAMHSKNNCVTPIVSPTAKDLPSTHQYDLPQSKAPASLLQLPKMTKKIESKAVLASVADRPRFHLGDTVYQVKLKPAKHFDPDHPGPSRFGYSSTPVPLPMDKIKDKENCTLTIKIPRAHLAKVSMEEITSRRAVWGTDIYTDDSDVIAACVHGGWIRGVWADDVSLDMIGVPKGPEVSPRVMKEPPREGPVPVPKFLDMHVTILVLPCLDEYVSTTRFGMTSREWGGRYDGFHSQHDGLSFMILSVRFTQGAELQDRLRGAGRRERMKKALQQIAASAMFDLSTPAAAKLNAKREGIEINKENRKPYINGTGTEVGGKD